MRVIVTRPQADAQRWVGQLRERGLEALALPLLTIGPAPDPGSLRRAWEHIGDYVALMFVSGSAVVRFFAARPAPGQGFGLAGAHCPRAWAVGPGTVRALRLQGLEQRSIDAPPADAVQFDSQALWQQVGATARSGSRVLIVRGADGAGAANSQAVAAAAIGRDWLAQQLAGQGVRVDFVQAYVRQAASLDSVQQQVAQAAAHDGSVWLFSSAQAVLALARNLPAVNWSGARALATHARIAQAARGAGFGVVCESRPDLAQIVASIESMA